MSSTNRVLTLLGYNHNRKLGEFKAPFRENRHPANIGANPWSPTTAVPDSLRSWKFGQLVCKLGTLGASPALQARMTNTTVTDGRGQWADKRPLVPPDPEEPIAFTQILPAVTVDPRSVSWGAKERMEEPLQVIQATVEESLGSGESTPAVMPPHHWNENREVFAYFLALTVILTVVLNMVNNLNGPGVPAVVLEPKTSSSQPTRRDSVSRPPYELCVSMDCQIEGRYLVDVLTWEFDPCENFYGFVCQGHRAFDASSDVQLRSELESRLSVLLRRQPTSNPELTPLRNLYAECNEPAGDQGLVSLREVLSLAGLPDWPYAVPVRRPVSVWAAAARVLRMSGAQALVAVTFDTHPNKPGQGIHRLGPGTVGSGTPTEAVTAALGAFRQKLLVPLYAAELDAFEKRLLRAPPGTVELKRLASFPQVAEFLGLLLGGGVHEGTEVLVEVDALHAVLSAVADTPVDTVLNFLGLQLTLKLTYFLPNELGLRLIGRSARTPRWRACLAQVEQALPELFLLASQAAQGVPAHAARFAEDVRRSLTRSLPGLLWFDHGTQRQAIALLARTRIRMFVPKELRNSSKETLLKRQGRRPEGSGLLAFCRLHERVVERRLNTTEPWLLSALDTDCAIDTRANRVDVPLLLFNRSALPWDDLYSSQLPRAGFRLARCVLKLLLRMPGGPRSTLDGKRAEQCLARQYALPTVQAPLEDSLAVIPVMRLFTNNLRHRRRLRQDMRLRNAEDLSMEHLFFVYYTLGFCGGGADAERRSNVPLWNMAAFQDVYECRPGSPMRPDRACTLWGPE
ncbi:hypothetical protein HPB47_027514 [Ixodes persulcatus]|uniref:Uncharacterized protein n=1 Tax=Ixodes persulcatus TaxID=34615 RepID=A0AC60PWV9_IXOPE|nr:hypothetical protein HPB47_027514 [Ixodes persulcatus]